MFEATLTLAGLGLVFGGLLALASKKLAVEVDPRIEQIRYCLPGANCGACGYGSCAQFADAVTRGEVPVSACIPGGCDVSHEVAEILGLGIEDEAARRVAVLLCLGDRDKARVKFDYDGVQDCKAAVLFDGGFKACPHACIGLATCVRACPFDAITMGDNGLPVIDREKCTGCGKCTRECPKKVLGLRSLKETPTVQCNSTAKGKEVRAQCDIGCIGCGICVKNCPEDAITMENNLALIDQEKCTNCGICVEKCPRDCIL